MGGTSGPMPNTDYLAAAGGKGIGAMLIPSGCGTGTQQENAAIMEALDQGLPPHYDDQDLDSFYDPREMLERQYPALMDSPRPDDAIVAKEGRRFRQDNLMEEDLLQNFGTQGSAKQEFS